MESKGTKQGIYPVKTRTHTSQNKTIHSTYNAKGANMTQVGKTAKNNQTTSSAKNEKHSYRRRQMNMLLAQQHRSRQNQKRPTKT